MTRQCELSLLIPVLNYEETLAETVRGLRDALQAHEVEILVVFDVTDAKFEAEVEEQRQHLADRFGVRSLVRRDERGFGSALRYAATQAEGRALVPIMADLSDDVAVITSMLAKVEDGADIVAGARYVKGGQTVGNTMKQRVSRVYSWLMKVLSEVRCGDVSNSFKMYRRDVWEAVQPTADSFDLSVELPVKAAELGYELDYVAATWTNRQVGSSNFNTMAELRSYGRWLLYAMVHMPSKLLIVLGLGTPLLVRRLFRSSLTVAA